MRNGITTRIVSAATKSHWSRLIARGEKTRSVELRASVIAARIDRDEARKIFVFRAESVEAPRAHRGPNELERSCMQLNRCLRMRRNFCLHAAKETEIVRLLLEIGKEIADPEPRLARLFELPRTREEFGVSAKGLPIHRGELRLVVERVDVRGRARHAEKDDALCSWGEVWLLRRERASCRIGFIIKDRKR